MMKWVERDGSLLSSLGAMLVNLMDDLGTDGIVRRWDQARRLIRENGITHNVYGDPNGLDRPWNSGYRPTASAGGGVERSDRRTGFNGHDCPMPAVGGFVRPEARSRSPRDGFRRSCFTPIPDFSAPAMASRFRTANGFIFTPPIWCDWRMGNLHVVTDRTQAPSGAGYCLENRIVLSSALPTAFRQCNVHRSGRHFSWRFARR